MPELPEVEASRRLVQNHCLGGTIVKASVVDDKKVIEGVTSSILEASLTGKKIVSAHRKGKHLWLQLDSQPWPSFQFGWRCFYSSLFYLFGFFPWFKSFLECQWT